MNKKKKIQKKILNYTAIFEPAEDGGFVVHVPSLQGCHTQGETLDEAYNMAQDAIFGYIKTLQELKQKVPHESNASIFVTKIPVKV